MRTTKRTGAWWFMQEICRIIEKQPPDSDGEYFFWNGGLKKQVDMLSILREWYAYLLLLKRFVRKRNENSTLRYWLHHKSRPGQRDGVQMQINNNYRSLAVIKQRLDNLSSPYSYSFNLEF